MNIKQPHCSPVEKAEMRAVSERAEKKVQWSKEKGSEVTILQYVFEMQKDQQECKWLEYKTISLVQTFLVFSGKFHAGSS